MPPETIQIPRAWLEALIAIQDSTELTPAQFLKFERLFMHIESAKSLLKDA